jgi:acyl carrier protein
MDIKEKIRQFLMDELKEISENGNVEYLKYDTPLIEHGILDSLMILSLFAFLEENFGILLSRGELNPKNFETIQNINDLIAQKLSDNR